MKKRALLTACALVLAIAGVTIVKANAHFVPAYYSLSDGSGCVPTTRPSGCNTPITGTICTMGASTYYNDAGCTVLLYKVL